MPDHSFLQHDPFYSTFIADQEIKAQSRMPTDTPGGVMERTWALSGLTRTWTMALSLIDPVAEASPFITLRLALLSINDDDMNFVEMWYGVNSRRKVSLTAQRLANIRVKRRSSPNRTDPIGPMVEEHFCGLPVPLTITQVLLELASKGSVYRARGQKRAYHPAPF